MLNFIVPSGGGNNLNPTSKQQAKIKTGIRCNKISQILYHFEGYNSNPTTSKKMITKEIFVSGRIFYNTVIDDVKIYFLLTILLKNDSICAIFILESNNLFEIVE